MVNVSGMNWVTSRVEKYNPKYIIPGLLSSAGHNPLPKEASVVLPQDPTQSWSVQRSDVPDLLP